MNRRNVLLISYLFPPAGGVGVQRALSYARYLPAHGCRLTVLCAANPSTPVLDPKLSELVPEAVKVVRCFTPEVPYAWRDWVWKRMRGMRGGRREAGEGQASGETNQGGKLSAILGRLATPDPQKVWVPWARRKAVGLIERGQIGTVLINVPPFSSLTLAGAIRRRFPGLRIICDYRDEFLSYYLPRLDDVGAQIRYRSGELMEREAVEAADYMLTVTEPWREAIRGRHTEQPDEKFLCIPNGYDPALFGGFRDRARRDEVLRIVYLGTVYTNPVYSPLGFLEGLKRLPDEVRERMRVRFVGRIAKDAEGMFGGFGDVLERVGFLPQAEGYRQLEEADCLLLIVGDAHAHSGKLFEYLATGKPIVALAPEGSQVRRLVEETGSGWCADSRDAAAIARLLEDLALRKRRGEWGLKREQAKIECYERPRLVGEMLRLTGTLE